MASRTRTSHRALNVYDLYAWFRHHRHRGAIASGLVTEGVAHRTLYGVLDMVYPEHDRKTPREKEKEKERKSQREREEGGDAGRYGHAGSKLDNSSDLQ